MIRDQRPEDDATVRQLVEDAFRGRPYSDGREPAILDALRAAGALTVALVAEEDGEIVGQVAFSPVSIDGSVQGWYGLGPVAVRPDRQGRGIGQALIRAGLDRIRALGAKGCVLAGAPGYYSRFGFAADPRLQSPGIPPQYFLVLSFGAEVPEGSVTFHPAFDAGS
ncbi:GNAT family N-acetyltransferase [Inquilinus limosus]|uniref:GNAT family N-acetyltransferase n=1 Tax=Inquilinus limosus TaxID=171674 RepID=A0A211ZIV3_9PROT|nr:N-acetyltransferase [Inquilinus limosus]OWJ65126.1 GNAT family N-acetyltransferase [Inquilinus limosus]